MLSLSRASVNPVIAVILLFFPVAPAYRKLSTSVQPVLSRNRVQSVLQPATLENLDDQRPKSGQKLTKICRHEHKDLVNLPTKGIDDSLHGLRGIDEKPSKSGVF